MSDTRRLEVLAAAVAAQDGAWTTRRVQRLYRALGYDAPLRRTARRDLTQLTRLGVLVRHDEDPGRRVYTRKEQNA